MRLGYSRVSSPDQSLDIQNDLLTKAGIERIYQEKASGTKMEGRDQMAALIITLRPGDEVYVTRLDRLARSVQDFLTIARAIEESGATLHCLLQPIETKTAGGRMFVTMLAAFAEFETEIRKQRQMEGIAAARAALKYRARPRGPAYDREVIWHMRTVQGMKPSKIAQKLGASEWTIRRALKEIGALKQKDAREEMEQSVPGGEVVLEVDGSSH